MKQAKITVKGRVQGVFFRATAYDEADKLGLNGYAHNMPDGSVECLVQGEEVAIKEFIEWCKKGPERALVEDINVEWQEVSKRYSDFETGWSGG